MNTFTLTADELAALAWKSGISPATLDDLYQKSRRDDAAARLIAALLDALKSCLDLLVTQHKAAVANGS